MLKCLQLAQKGFGKVSPNPMVGCVIVHNDEIIGEGYHQTYGKEHAEVNAIHSVNDHSLLAESTVYVSLEPCSHFGKTPPCADLLIEKGVKEVVIGTLDPNPKVGGNGIIKLKEAGIVVRYGFLEKECRKINRRFFTNQILNRPYVILKWAESADGFMAGGPNKQISGLVAQTRVHKWRSEEDAFMVGANTLINDNPILNTRLWKGKDPIRIAVDFHLRSEGLNLHFFQKGLRSILLNGKKEGLFGNTEYILIKNNDPKEILQALYNLQISSVVIEGGAQILKSFLQANAFDEIRLLRSKKLIIDEGLSAPKIDFLPKYEEDLLDDTLTVY